MQSLIRVISLGIFLAAIIRSVMTAAKVDARSKSLQGAVFISTIAPRVGEYILSKEVFVSRARERFNATYREEMLEQRLEFRKMFVEHAELVENTPKHVELVNDIIYARKRMERRYTLGEVAIGVGGGIVALVAGVVSPLAGFGLLVSIYLVLFPVSMLLRGTVIETLSFSGNPYDVENDEKHRYRLKTLAFMKGWNEMLLRNQSIMHKLILASAVRGEFTEGYEMGQRLVERAYAGEITVADGLDEAVEGELGDGTKEARLVRGYIKQVVDV
jgi:hypothetical protein